MKMVPADIGSGSTRGEGMFNFNSSKTKRIIAGAIVVMIVLAMVIGVVASALFA